MTISDVRPTSQGKVRDLYDLGDQLLMVASDRISAFDYILPDEIPYKGEVLTRLSLFWLDYLGEHIGNHLISADVVDLPLQFAPYADYLRGRFMLVHKAQMFPVECIVRGYLAGSGLKEYQRQGTVCGNVLPQGLVASSKLPEPIFTPSTKAALGDHDENISFEQASSLMGVEAASTLRDQTIALYVDARDHAAHNGVMIADTKFEFGTIDGEVILCDEVLTPDSSRFWPASAYEPGRSQDSFDKQYVRDWLSANWDMKGEPPHLPAEVIEKTTTKYIQAFELITGKKFVPAAQCAAEGR